MTQQLHGFVNDRREQELLTQAALACAALTLTLIDDGKNSAGESSCALNRAINYYRSHGSPALLIVDISAQQEPLTALAQLAEVCQASTRVLLLGERDDLGFYRQLMALGVDDYVALPADETQLRAQLRLLSEPHARFHNNATANDTALSDGSYPLHTAPRGRNMVVTATHGGIGCSLISALIASKLSRDPGMHLALLDLDCAGSLDIYLNSPASAAFASLLAEPDNADELLVQRAGNELHPRLTLFSSVLDINAAEQQRGLFQQGGIIAALTAKLAPQFSALCWDLPAAENTSPLATELLKNADHILLITHPHPAAARQLKRLQDFYQQQGLLDKVHILVNQPYASSAVSIDDIMAVNPFVNVPVSYLQHDKSALKHLLDEDGDIQRSRLSTQVDRFVDQWLALPGGNSQHGGIISRLLRRGH